MGIDIRTARTTIVDEVDEAVDELIRELELNTLKAQSVAILYCHYDYVDSGIIEALHQRLGFDVVGMTSTSNGTEQNYDMYGLSVAVLTSDDVGFAAAMTESLTTDTYKSAITATYERARDRITKDPALCFTFLSYIEAITGAEMLRVFDLACKGAPCWGSSSSGVDLFFTHCYTIYNDRIVQDGFVMLLLDGDVKPQFIIEAIPDELISEVRGVVTKSADYHLAEIDGRPAVEFLNSFGLNATKDNLPATSPLMVYYKRAVEPVALGVYTVFDDGSLLVAANIEEGATLAIGSITTEGILQTAKKCMERVRAVPNKQGVLILPCCSRFFMLSPNMHAEQELIREELDEKKAPALIGYSGGEICPVQDESGNLVNRFHNYTITACVL
ncbi:MAG: FIST C-terminal domain-containing protein [Coriobacteriales bacterium]|jgi:hypothetical protein|nr:FIST C-terminal domain-containing protein [Coriobacteriales bacterium]